MTQKQMRTTSLVYPYDPMSARSSSRMAEVFAALTWGFDVVGTLTSSVVVVVVVVDVVVVVVVVIASIFVTFVCKTFPPIVVSLSEEFPLSVASVVERKALLARVKLSLSVVKGPALEGPGSGTLVKFLPTVAVTSTTDTSVSITVVVTLLSGGISVTPP